jgi:hypothetical protein
MQAEARRFAERWRHCAVEGRVIQIRGESILFKPRVFTRSFWLYLKGQGEMPSVGELQLVVNPAVFDCKRIIVRRTGDVKLPLIDDHGDEMEHLRGRLGEISPSGDSFVLDIGFPVVISLLEPCHELDRAREGEILDLELAPPAQGHLL